MRFLILNTDYPEFLEWFYSQHPGLESRCYREQSEARYRSGFGVGDFYSRNLRELGHEAVDLYANNQFLQQAWMADHVGHTTEQGEKRHRWKLVVQGARHRVAQTPLRWLKPLAQPLLRKWDQHLDESHRILRAQIKYYRPDVLLNQAMDGIAPCFLREVKQQVGLLIGQHAATRLPATEEFGCYDLVVSSFQPTVDYFRAKRIPAVLHRLAFEPRMLSGLTPAQRQHPVSFVGSLSKVHKTRILWLESLCQQIQELRIWGTGIEQLPADSPLRTRYEGPAWGRDMYQILVNSKITLNHHGDVAPYANNCRLYEATGVGSMLITDWRVNLQELFASGREVVAYRSAEECAEQVRYYLEHNCERAAIARAGQQRTLRDHTYRLRMQELVDIVQKRLHA